MLECEKWLSRSDLRVIRGIDVNDIEIDEKDLGIVKRWKEFNRDLKESLAGMRRARKSGFLEKAVSGYSEIFEESTPLLMERRMERIRWDFIEQWESFYDFDINRLIIFFWKLQILERLAVFDKLKGREEFDGLCEV